MFFSIPSSISIHIHIFARETLFENDTTRNDAWIEIFILQTGMAAVSNGGHTVENTWFFDIIDYGIRLQRVLWMKLVRVEHQIGIVLITLTLVWRDDRNFPHNCLYQKAALQGWKTKWTTTKTDRDHHRLRPGKKCKISILSLFSRITSKLNQCKLQWTLDITLTKKKRLEYHEQFLFTVIKYVKYQFQAT